jgi:hypothetical protein
MKIEKLKTSKLFYNKWPYKVACYLAHVNTVISNKNIVRRDYRGYRKKITPNEQIDLETFSEAVEPLLKKDIKYRVEHNHFNIFCGDITILEQINKQLNPWIQHIYGPASNEELEYLKTNGHKKRVRDKLPKGSYQYRVYFKRTMPGTTKESFLNWALKYEDKIALSKTTKGWMEGKYPYCQGPFMYVKDGAILSMVGLFLSTNIKLVEEFVLRESINIPSE